MHINLDVDLRGGDGIELIDSMIEKAVRKLKTPAFFALNIIALDPYCALSVNENCDATVRADHLRAFERMVGENAEAKACLMSRSLTLPFEGPSFKRGTWQGVYAGHFGSEGKNPCRLLLNVIPGEKPTTSSIDIPARSSINLPSTSSPELFHELHTSASLCAGKHEENLEIEVARIVPETWNDDLFEHTYEGPDDMPGHMKSTLLGCSLLLPPASGSSSVCALLNEHRDAGGWGVGHRRKLCRQRLQVEFEKASLVLDGDARGVRDVTDDVLKILSQHSSKTRQTDLFVVCETVSSINLVLSTSKSAVEKCVEAGLGGVVGRRHVLEFPAEALKSLKIFAVRRALEKQKEDPVTLSVFMTPI